MQPAYILQVPPAGRQCACTVRCIPAGWLRLGMPREPLQGDVDVGGLLAADAVHAHLALAQALRQPRHGTPTARGASQHDARVTWHGMAAVSAPHSTVCAHAQGRTAAACACASHGRVNACMHACMRAPTLSCICSMTSFVPSAPGRSFLLASTSSGTPRTEGFSSSAASSRAASGTCGAGRGSAVQCR